MNYNPFPVNYQPAQFYTPYQQPQQQPPQMMSPPTIRAEIVQVDNEQAAANYPVGAGASQMMMARDDSAIFVKTATPNGFTLDVFVKRPPKPQAEPFDPSAYVRRDEINGLVMTALEAYTASNTSAQNNEEAR